MKLSGDLNSLLLNLVLTSVFVTAAESKLEEELPATRPANGFSHAQREDFVAWDSSTDLARPLFALQSLCPRWGVH